MNDGFGWSVFVVVFTLIVGIFIGGLWGSAIGFTHGSAQQIAADLTQVVNHQCAHYDSKTGAFTWNSSEISP